jgi:mannose-6-phosphate isomerase-like protein (cupin superfamily)
MNQDFFDISELLRERKQQGRHYLEFLRRDAMSAGVYVLPAGGTDPQKPHKQDELYYVVSGRARMKVATQDREVKAGTVIFVAADVDHRFYDISEELVVLVFFAPAESS